MEELLPYDGIIVKITSFIPLITLIYLIQINKNLNQSITKNNEIWKNLLAKYIDKKHTKINTIYLPANYYIEYKKLYGKNSEINNIKINITNLSPTTSTQHLIMQKFGKEYVIQSIRDIDWEYVFHSGQIIVDRLTNISINLNLTLSINNEIIISFNKKITLNNGIIGIYEIKTEELTINFRITESIYMPKYVINYDEYTVFLIQYPLLIISDHLLHEKIFEANMANQSIEYVYQL